MNEVHYREDKTGYYFLPGTQGRPDISTKRKVSEKAGSALDEEVQKLTKDVENISVTIQNELYSGETANPRQSSSSYYHYGGNKANKGRQGMVQVRPKVSANERLKRPPNPPKPLVESDVRAEEIVDVNNNNEGGDVPKIQPAPRPKVPSSKCVCFREMRKIICRICAFIFEGRVSQKCEEHPRDRYLLDQTVCPECKAGSKYLCELPRND